MPDRLNRENAHKSAKMLAPKSLTLKFGVKHFGRFIEVARAEVEFVGSTSGLTWALTGANWITARNQSSSRKRRSRQPSLFTRRRLANIRWVSEPYACGKVERVFVHHRLFWALRAFSRNYGSIL